MHFRVTCDANADSGVGEVVDELSGPLRQHFVDKDYGFGLDGVVVVLMCRDRELDLKRRLRFSRKDKKLYMDVMLDIGQMQPASSEVRESAIANRLILEIPETVHRFAIKDFDLTSFTNDLRRWFAERGIAVTSDAVEAH